MKSLRKLFDDFLFGDRDEFPGLLRPIIAQLRLYVYIARQLVRDNCLERACALSYTTVLAIVPVVTVAFAFYRSFTGLGGIEEMVKQKMFNWLLAQPHIVEEVKKATPPESADSQDEANKILRNYAATIAEWIKKLSAQLSSTVVGIASLFFLVLTSVFLLNTIEGAFNNIWNVTKRRSYVYKMCVFWVIITLGPAFIGASFVLTSRVQEWFNVHPNLNLVNRALFRLLPILATCAAFFLMYVLVPNVKVRWRSALAGAIVAGILWEFAKVGFSLYITKVVFMYSKTYGSLGLIPIFLLWVFLTWLIVLFGVEVTYTSQNIHSIRSEDRRIRRGAIPAESIAVRLVLLVTRAFTEGGKRRSLQALAREMGLAEDEVRPVADRLMENGILTAVANGPDPVFLPAKASDAIRIREVIHAVRFETARAFSGNSEEQDVRSLFAKVDQATDSIMGETTFHDLLLRTKSATPRVESSDAQ